MYIAHAQKKDDREHQAVKAFLPLAGTTASVGMTDLACIRASMTLSSLTP